MEENNQKVKKGFSIETVCWMLLTALVVYVIMSYHYTKITLESEDNYNYYSTSGDDFKKLKRVLKILEEDYLFEYDMETLEEGAISGMLSALDEPYTSYFNLKQTEEFLTETEGEYEGVGMYLTIDTTKNMPMVLLPIKNSPAEEANIKTGDYILEIDGEDVSTASLEEVAGRVKGKNGTKVTIKFMRINSDDTVEQFEKELTRRKIDLYPFTSRILENNIGYVAFESFDEKVGEQFKTALNEMMNKNKIKGLIVDLRDNPGGLLTTASEIADELLPTGVITYTVDKNGKKEYIYSDSKHIDIPIVVIVNENSASASEITAAAIKDSENGKVVGTTSYGKGLVQEFKSLRDGTYIKVTISEYFSPKGTKINKIGVEPDYEVEDNPDTDEDEQLEKAIEVIKEMIK